MPQYPDFTDLFVLGLSLLPFTSDFSWVSDLNDYLSGSFAERAHRTRRQASTGLNGTELCSGGMDLNTANQICPEPELKIIKYSSCVKYIECDGRRIGRLADGGHEKSHDPGCRIVHGYGLISVCYGYICNIVSMDQHHYNYRNNHQQGSRSRGGSGEGSGQGSDEEESSEEGSGEEEGSGDVLEWL